jgi:hypothetical protein
MIHLSEERVHYTIHEKKINKSKFNDTTKRLRYENSLSGTVHKTRP